MKFTLILVALVFSSMAIAREELLDLESIKLNLETSETPIETINYPSFYRKVDCLILDVESTDIDVTTEMKLQLANRLLVKDGVQIFENDYSLELKPTLKGDKVVFYLQSESAYLTQIKVAARDSNSLQSNIYDALKVPATRVGLVYVRSCRF